MSRRRVLEPTGAREHVRGPDVIPTATVKGAREGARVGIMSVGARELRVGRPSRDKTRIPLMSVSGFNNLQSHPDAIRAVFDCGAKSVVFYAVGHTAKGTNYYRYCA